MKRTYRPISKSASATKRNRTKRWQDTLNDSVNFWRIIFVLFLLGLSALFGYLAHTLVTNSERTLAENQYESLSDRALTNSFGLVIRKASGAQALSKVVASANPDAGAWPYVGLTDYESITNKIIDASAGDLTSLLPLITPDQITAYEDFAYDYYEKNGYPNTTGLSSIGRGIWMDNGIEVLPADGSTLVGDSPYEGEILTPLFLHSQTVFDLQMINLRYYPTIGNTQDRIITCDLAVLNGTYTNPAGCGDLSDVIQFRTEFYGDSRPGTYMQMPIYPFNNQSSLVGFIGTGVVFEDLLEEGFTESTSGIDCVFSSTTQSYTYEITDGVAKLKGAGDLHDADYDEYAKSKVITENTDIFSDFSQKYTLTIYPSKEYFDTYTTINAQVATIGAVCIMLLTSMLFFAYDFFVRKEFKAKKLVLDAKRQFVRFISHEVRTPMNTVCMGLRLLIDEIKASPVTRKHATSWSATQTAQLSKRAAGKDHDCSKVHTTDSRGNETVIIAAKADSFKPQENDSVPESNPNDWLTLTEETLTNAHKAVSVLNDILNYDKIESSTLTLEKSIFSMWDLIETTVMEFRLQAKKAEVNLVLDFSDLIKDSCEHLQADTEGNLEESKALTKSPLFSSKDIRRELQKLQAAGDLVRLSQVLRNLTSNALKFTPAGGTVHVKVAWVSERRRVEHIQLANKEELRCVMMGNMQLHVKDSGVGLSAEQVSRIFGEGVQFNANILQGGNGSGLGLFIAKGIVEQHGGSLGVSSEGLNKGTTFTMTLPLLYADVETEGRSLRTSSALQKMTSSSIEEEPDTRGRGLPQDRPLRLLVVDDSVSNRKMLQRILRFRRHVCDMAENGCRAVEMYMQAEQSGCPYDAILMDNQMPEMDGPAAAKQIRALGCHYLIIGITGNVLPEDITEYLAAGADCVLPKPLNITDLEITFKNHINRPLEAFSEEVERRRKEFFLSHSAAEKDGVEHINRSITASASPQSNTTWVEGQVSPPPASKSSRTISTSARRSTSIHAENDIA